MSKATEAVEAALRERYDFIDISQLSHDDEVWDEISQIAADAVIDALFPGEPVRAWYPWKTNADLVYDVWRAGYVKGHVFDATPGVDGLWWRRLHNPLAEGITGIVLNDLGKGRRLDFRDTGFDDGVYNTVAFDPPYKLNGNPAGLAELSRRYGVDVPAKWQDRHKLMLDGLMECLRITKPGGYCLVKCQDQVVSGKIRWQTKILTDFAQTGIIVDYDEETHNPIGHRFFPRAHLIERFDMLGHHIPQPMGPSKRYPGG